MTSRGKISSQQLQAELSAATEYALAYNHNQELLQKQTGGYAKIMTLDEAIRIVRSIPPKQEVEKKGKKL